MSGGLPAGVRAALTERLATPPARSRRVHGGSINDAFLVELAEGPPVFVKFREGADPDEFASEAAGLAWLAGGGASTPRVLAALTAPPLLALEWIEPGRLDRGGAEAFGRELAELHRAGAERFGTLPPGASATRPLRIGSLELAVSERPTWAEFHASEQLLPLARRAYEAGSLEADGLAAVERVCERLEELAGPPEPPARLHGDLWSGNVLAGADGRARLIDPAAYGGHREIDLAMLELFGSPSPHVLGAYAEAFPLADGARERVRLWQLLPLLVHAVLFGGSYGAQASGIAGRYA